MPMPESLVPGPSMVDDASVDIFALDGYDDAQLDDLRFGVICLDPHGTILRYNLAEARMARLDRSKVVGRDFFRRIAPCTATPEFEGRFRTFTAGTEGRMVFPFVFDFKFGAQEVTIELVRSTTPGRFYLCVNRMSFRPARPAFEAVAAPRQAELVPDEAALGVLRDDAEQRLVMLPAAALRALRMTWDRIAPQGWALFASEWGFRWGRLAIIDLETEMMERHDRSLRDLPVEEALQILCLHIEKEGWGRLSIDVTSSAATARGAAIITIERSALAEAAGSSEMPRCQLMAGLVRAMLGHVAQRVLAVSEVCCAAQGAARCELIAVAHSRRARLDSISGGARPTDARTALSLLDGVGGPAPRAGDVLARLF
jgi:photoactive yellow protein